MKASHRWHDLMRCRSTRIRAHTSIWPRQARAASHARLRERVQKQRMEQCTFAPDIKDSGRSLRTAVKQRKRKKPSGTQAAPAAAEAAELGGTNVQAQAPLVQPQPRGHGLLLELTNDEIIAGVMARVVHDCLPEEERAATRIAGRPPLRLLGEDLDTHRFGRCHLISSSVFRLFFWGKLVRGPILYASARGSAHPHLHDVQATTRYQHSCTVRRSTQCHRNAGARRTRRLQMRPSHSRSALALCATAVHHP